MRKLNVTLILNKTSSISDVKKVINKMNGIRNELLKKIVKVVCLFLLLKHDNFIAILSEIFNISLLIVLNLYFAIFYL